MWLQKTILATSENGTLWYEFHRQRASSLLRRPWIRVQDPSKEVNIGFSSLTSPLYSRSDLGLFSYWESSEQWPCSWGMDQYLRALTINPYSRSSEHWTCSLGAEFISKASVSRGRQNRFVQPHDTFFWRFGKWATSFKMSLYLNFSQKRYVLKEVVIFQTSKQSVAWLQKIILTTS